MISRRYCLKLIAVSTVAGATLPVSPVRAGQWPHRPVRVIVPLGAGSATDFAARIYADRLSARWKQPVIVENRPGADGLIGTGAFVAARDDHALLFSFAAPISVHPFLHANLPYDPGRDLVAISLAADTFAAVSAHASLNVGSLKELVSLARAQPGKLNYFAQGAFPYLLAGFFRSEHLDVVPISYRQFNLGLQDHAQGRVHLSLSVTTSLLPLVQSGHARFLAVTNSRRAPNLADVPTAAESGFPALTFEGLTGFFGGGGMPAGLVDHISEDIRAVAAEPAVAARLAAAGQVAHGSTPAEFAALVEAQRIKMGAIVQETGVLPSH